MKQRKMMEINEKTSMFLLAGPIFAELLLNILLNNVDTMMLGHYSDNAVGAVGNANQMMMLFIIMFSAIASATGVVVSQYLGAKKTKSMNQIYTLAFTFNLILGVLISAVLFFFCGFFLKLLKVDALQLSDAIMYMKVVGGMLFLQAGYNVMIQILRCNGFTRAGMFISLTVNLINVAGNYIFLYGPLKHLNLGVIGVAISTDVARVAAILIAIFIFYRNKIGHLDIKLLKPFPFSLLFRMLKVGIPSAGENLAYSFYQLVLLSFVNSMGAVSVNAKVYANTLMSFSVVFSNSMAQATQIVTGHLIGAGKEREADRRVMRTLLTALPVAVAIASVNCVLCPITLKLFTESTEVIPLVRQILLIGILMEVGRTTNLVIIGSMKAAGDVLFPVLVGMLSMWGVGISVGYSFGVALSFGVAGVFAGTMTDECVRGIIVFIRWKLGKWKGKSLVKTAATEE